jgi:hypothetical protein
MSCGRLGVGVTLSVALATAAWAQDRPPMEFAPDEISRPDAGAPAPPAPPPPQAAAAPTEPVAAPPQAAAAPPESAPPPPKAAAAPTIAAAEAPAPSVGPRVSLHVWEPEKTNRFGPEEIIEAAMGEVLAADSRLRFLPLETILSPPAAAAAALADADQALARGKQAYADMDLDKAKPLLESALKSYQKYLPELAARPDAIAPMRDGFIALADVRFFEGNQDGAKDALRYVFALDGTVRWNKEQFPQQMKRLVVEARLLYETLGNGRLVIDSDPQGAAVWLNGIKLPDRTPSQPIDAPNGPSFISYARRGYAPTTQAFVVGGGGEQSHALATLSRYPHNPLAPIDRARASIDDSPKSAALERACAQLGIDLLVLVRTSRAGDRDDEEPQMLTAYLYDARAARVINRREMKVEGDLPATARVLARELFHGVRLDGVWQAPKAPSRPSWNQRLWSSMKDDLGQARHWKGFWYVVGGVAVAAVVGTVAGVATYGHQRAVAADTILLGGH